MKKPIRIEEEDFKKLHKLIKKKTKYIKKLELSLDSVKRQLSNAKA